MTKQKDATSEYLTDLRHHPVDSIEDRQAR